MSYLFIVIALAVINALAPQTTGWGIILLANIGIWSLAFILERLWFVKHLTVKIVVYDKIELIKAGRRKELTADLEDRTGVKIHSLEIGKVDLLRDTAVIRVHFYADLQEDHFEETRNTP